MAAEGCADARTTAIRQQMISKRGFTGTNMPENYMNTGSSRSDVEIIQQMFQIRLQFVAEQLLAQVVADSVLIALKSGDNI